jgi:2-polyprenyl-3-methyl-5-hydroxy-6-metoxy-1,4-benzoquinol methylase
MQLLYEGWWADRQRTLDEIHLRQIWNFGAPAEQERYRYVLGMLRRGMGSEQWGDALEIGCAEGLFTLELASHCQSVTAWDISSIACKRATARCVGHSNVRIEHRDLLNDDLTGRYDLIFAMDSLEHVHGRSRGMDVIEKLVKALRPNGYLVFCGCRLPERMRAAWWARWLGEGADIWIEILADGVGLQLLFRDVHPAEGRSISGYVEHAIALFQKTGSEDPLRGENAR